MFRGTAWWMFFLGAVLAQRRQPRHRRAGRRLAAPLRLLRAAIVYAVYMLNGGRTLTVWSIARSLTWLWLATIVGGYLAFLLGSFSFRSPLYYALPDALLENDLIETLVTPRFADVQDIIGVTIPRPTAPFPYTNAWGSMLALAHTLRLHRDSPTGGWASRPDSSGCF